MVAPQAPDGAPVPRQLHPDGEAGARAAWEAHDALFMAFALQTAKLKALELTNDPEELDRIVADDESVIRTVLRRNGYGVEQFGDLGIMQPPDEIVARLGARPLSSVSTAAPPPLLIDRLDPFGHSILYGAGGVGKGVLASDWLVSLRAAGMRPLIIDYENHPDEWARRIFGLAGAELMDGIMLVAPLTSQWGGKRGPIWDQAPDLLKLATAISADFLLVDSIVPACAGTDPLKPEAVALYTGALEYIGLPTLSLAHVPKDGDLKAPFGSVFWHNLARVTYSLERAGETSILTNRKANNYEKRPKQAVEVNWEEGRPQSVWEKPYQALLGQRIAVALGDGPLTVNQIVDVLNDELDDEDAPMLKADSVRKALNRGVRVRPPVFVKDGDRWSRA